MNDLNKIESPTTAQLLVLKLQQATVARLEEAGYTDGWELFTLGKKQKVSRQPGLCFLAL